MISLASYLQWAVRQSAETENYMTSVERIVEYKDIQSEETLSLLKYKNKELSETDANNKKMIDVPDNWPANGKIEIKNLYARYRDHLDFVLKDINITINSHEKIGIVGRTGSGKSSLFLSFFRLLEAYSGCIIIDDININNLKLNCLRSKLSIIPQSAVLFSETIRYNIDPFNEYSDAKILNALKIVKLDELVLSLPQGLNTMMSEHGSNFSVGESQLICVARALLKESTILLVDEATSSVDPNTDILIQNILKTKFKNRTVLTIAHRLQTVLDCDRILVLKSGIVKEFDTPKNLLAKDWKNDDNAVFAKMYEESIKASKRQH